MLQSVRTIALGAALLNTAMCAAQSMTPEAIAADADQRAAAIAAATPAAPLGCVALLCLANPRGPTAVAQCVDPIRQLWGLLRARRPFPSCPMARGPQGGAMARLGSDYYDPCPNGTAELPIGQYAYSANVTTLDPTGLQPPLGLALTEPVANLATAPSTTGSTADAGATPIPPRVCGAGLLGQSALGSGDSTTTVGLYEELVLIQAASSPNYVEVLIDRGDGRGFTSWTRTRY